MPACTNTSGSEIDRGCDEPTPDVGFDPIKKKLHQEAKATDAEASISTSEESRAPAARFHLRICSSEVELGVANFAELQRLYHSGFVAPEDEIRREGSHIWQKAGTMLELRTVKPRPWLEGNEFALLAALICALSLLLIFLLR